MNYSVIPQDHSSFLKQFSAGVYLLSNDQEPIIYHTVANGLIGLGIILNGTAEILVNDNWEEIPTFSVFGMVKKSCQIRLSKNYKELSIGFKPYHFNLFVREKLKELSLGKITDATAIFEKDRLDQLYEILLKKNNDFAKMHVLDEFFKIHYLASRENQRVQFATQQIYLQNADKVDDIAAQLSVTPTTLRNAFREHIGVSPKELIKITRVYRALDFQKYTSDTLTQLSYELGYFDQAHFIKEFKGYMGMAPKDYFKNKKLAFDFYNYGRWISGNFEL